MASYQNPMLEAQPFEESQGGSPKSATADELKAFYQDMERREILERKLSKRKSASSNAGHTSIWSRKSVKKSTSTLVVLDPVHGPGPTPQRRPVPPVDVQNESGVKDWREEQMEKTDQLPSLQIVPSRSLIPDVLEELPAWFNKDAWLPDPYPSYRAKYPIHNPVGPRWYRNHHLIAPLNPRSGRPSSVFSPSFPPMTPSINERSEDATRLAGPSRTPSGSPLPTPNSSETRVQDTNGRRSRKTSQTAHDNVDLLDVSDPWGTNWHHQSPYDIGLTNNSVSVDVSENPSKPRSRRSSITTSRRKTVTPSPLSQSTSAIHLQVPSLDGVRLPRKLSKRRTPVLGSLFGSHGKHSDRNAVSAPTSPQDQSPSPRASMIQDRPAEQPSVPTRLHDPPPSAVPHNMTKTEKRGSVLGRLVKKFSILKKPSPDSRNAGAIIGIDDAKSDKVSRRSEATTRQPSSDKPQLDTRRSTDPAPVKRVPPPSVELEPSLPRDTNVPKVGENLPDPDRRSSMISLETPFPVSMGRLTVANPDESSSGDNTPSQSTAPLPPEKPEPVPQVPEKTVEEPVRNASLPIPPISSPAPISTRTISAASPHSAPSPDQSRPQHDTSEPRSRAESTKPVPPREVTPEAPRQVSEHQSSRHRAERPQAPPPRPSSEKSKTPSVSSVVPFPVAEQPRSPALMAPAVSFPSVIEDSPYSASSMIVNPPTPHTVEPRSITPPPTVPKLEKRRSRDPSPNPQVSTVTSRETETYRLVRSPSGNMHPTTEMIVGAGEQWEVVGTTRSTSSKDKSTKSKDRESGSRKEHRRQEKTEEAEQHRVRSQTRHQSVTGPVASSSSSSKLPRASSLEVRKRPAIPDSLISQKDESKSSRKRDGDREQRRSEDREQRRSEDRGQRRSEDREQRRSEDRERRRDDDRERRRDDDKERRRGEDRERRRDEDRERKQEEERDRRHSEDRHRRSDRKHPDDPSPTSLNVNKPQPAPPPPTPGPPAAVQLERRPSASARPMSELPSAADFNALRAREAWDMERLWKAKSLYEAEPSGMVSAPMPVPSAELYGPAKNLAANGMHGSSHTSFMVQTPFQGQTSHQIYHSLPVNPPPIMYPTSLPQTLHHSSSAHSYPNHHPHHSYPHSYSSPEPLMTIPHSNPLPEPPRESSYSPAPLPPQAWARVVTSNAQ